MGNREDLLIGAKRCLFEKGYLRTTARDIVQASGTNLASIGYHYGSKEALLNQALVAAAEEWGDKLRTAIRGSGADEGADGEASGRPLDRFEAAWTRVSELFAGDRGLWAANFEVLNQLEQPPELRRVLADSIAQAKHGLASIGLGRGRGAQSAADDSARTDTAVASSTDTNGSAGIAAGPAADDDESAKAEEIFYETLLMGVMTHWMLDPDNAPTGRELATALRTIVANIADDPAEQEHAKATAVPKPSTAPKASSTPKAPAAPSPAASTTSAPAPSSTSSSKPSSAQPSGSAAPGVARTGTTAATPDNPVRSVLDALRSRTGLA